MTASCATLRLEMFDHSREGAIRTTTRGVEQQLFPENESFGFSSTKAIFPNVQLDPRRTKFWVFVSSKKAAHA